MSVDKSFTHYSYKELTIQSMKEKPYEVFHSEGQYPPPTFKNWKDALAAQKAWNKECSGHKARKRRLIL